MFSSQSLLLKFPEKTLALTYDDGPGPQTTEIAEFLHKCGIRATFFVVGQFVRDHRDVVRRVRELGHLIGNHTNNHRDLTNLLPSPDTLIDEVLEADHLIEEFVGTNQFVFRAPYGKWAREVAEVLNRRDELHKYLGPINWDIHHRDYEIGSPRNLNPKNELYTLQECENNYLEDIAAKGAGVVLLHDWSADFGLHGDQLRRNNRTLELTKRLVAQLAGFKFGAFDQMRVQEN